MALIVDVLIVGSGALGCATAYYLTQAGMHRVAIVDRGPLVSGMTRRNAGLVHTQQASETCVQLAAQSLEVYRHWGGLVGGACGFVETGTLVTAENETAMDTMRERGEMHSRLGVETRLVPRRDWGDLFPQVSFDGVAGVSLEPASGYVDPVTTTQEFARRAGAKGAQFKTGSLVKQIIQERGQVAKVVTTTGTVESPVVIIAAGAGAERLIAPLGITLDLQGVRGIVGFFERPSKLHDGHPTILDLETNGFLRPHSFNLSALGITDRSSPAKGADTLDEVVSDRETRTLRELTRKRLPDLTQAPLKRAHSILYDRMPDDHPVLGAVPGVAGLYVAAGFGEDVIAVAPAVGRILSELVVDGRTSLDIKEFRLTRQSITHIVEKGVNAQ